MLTNTDIARVLREIGEYLEMEGEIPFKSRAYEKAAEAIAASETEMSELYQQGGLKALEEIEGVGVSIAEKIEELLTTGRLRYYEQLKKKTPVNLSELLSVGGLGPKHIFTLYKKLGIHDLSDLEAAARAGKIRKITGFGEKTEENILKGIEFVKKSGGRFLLSEALTLAREIEARLRRLPHVAEVVIAGSVRRRKETIGDIDLLIISRVPQPVMDFFVAMPGVAQVLAHGETKSAVRLKDGLEVDLRVVPEESYGAALNYFTGSKEHNVALRQRAIERGYKLNEYGLFKGETRIAGRTEKELYQALGVAYIEPELREMRGELEAAAQDDLPHLIGYDDLRGDLQVQTDWTDGAHSIEEMALAAHKAGLEYIVITDHTKRLAMTGGLDAERVRAQMKEIAEVNKNLHRRGIALRVLAGTECDILKQGDLDLPDEVLAQLDVVGASVHSYFSLPRKEQTERIAKAMQNPHVDIIFHPTGRMLRKRPAYEVDIELLVSTAAATGTVMEVDAYPDRLDLKDEHIRRCVEKGVKLAIDSDAHSNSHFSVLEYGIAQARRGWAEKKDVINAWPCDKMLAMLKHGKEKIH